MANVGFPFRIKFKGNKIEPVNHNEYINSKLKEVSVEQGLDIDEELFQILDKEETGLGWRLIKWELMFQRWPLSMFVNLWYSSTLSMLRK